MKGSGDSSVHCVLVQMECNYCLKILRKHIMYYNDIVSIIVSNMASITMIYIGCGSDISDVKGKRLLSTDECIAEIFP